MTGFGIQIVSLIIIFGVTLVFGVLPFKMKKSLKMGIGIKLLNCFTGGMFISLALVHILPEALETYSKCSHDHHTHHHVAIPD